MWRIYYLKRSLRRPLERIGLISRPPGIVRRPKAIRECSLYLQSAQHPDQASLFANAHRDGPLQYDKDHQCWVVIGYQEIMDALSNDKTFSHEYMAQFDPFLAGTSGKSHQEYRLALQKAAPWFDKSSIANFTQGWMNDFCQQLRDRRTFDAVADFGIPLPRAFTINLLGLTSPEVEMVVKALHRRRTEMTAVQHALGQALTQIIQTRSKLKTAAPGLIQELTVNLSKREAMHLVRHLWFAGTVTLSGLLPACVRYLSRDPGLALTLRQNPAQIPAFVSEVLRLESISQFLHRCCTENIIFAGQHLHAGDLVLLHLGAANRDPSIFSQPDKLSLDLPAYKHLGFGHGSHSCLGAVIAKTIAETAMSSLLDNFRMLRPLDPHQLMCYEKSPQFRELRHWHTSITESS